MLTEHAPTTDAQSAASNQHRRAPSVLLVHTPPALLEREDAAAFMALSVAQFEREVAAGRLPKPRQVSKRRTAWLYTELVAAAQALPISQLAPGPGRRVDQGEPQGA